MPREVSLHILCRPLWLLYTLAHGRVGPEGAGKPIHPGQQHYPDIPISFGRNHLELEICAATRGQQKTKALPENS